MAESVVEATVGAWLKSVGDRVEAGETVLELETDKVNLEVTAQIGGTIEKVEKTTGAIVGVGEVLGFIAEGAVGSAPALQPAPANQAVAAESRPQAAGTVAAVKPQPQPAESRESTPVARRLAESSGIDLNKVPGSGRGGKVTKEDVEAAMGSTSLAGQAPAQPSFPPPLQTPAQPAAGREERVRLSRRRLTIAQRMADVQRDAVMTTTYNEADLSNVIALRKKHRDGFQEKHGVSLGFMSFFVKAVVSALQKHRVLNSELQDAELVYKNYYDIGIAVAAEDGLVVPVVRDADRKSFAGIEKEIRELAGKAREKKLTLEELRGGTFTITNGGVFGSLFSTPILNPPQVGILGMHTIKERPVAVDGQVVIRPMMYLAATYDHRVVEGADAVQFLVRVKEQIEDPERLLLDM